MNRPSQEFTAWVQTAGGIAVLCAWCADLSVARERVRAAGLHIRYTVCPECRGKQTERDVTAESFAAGPRFVVRRARS